MNIEEIAKRIAELHYRNKPNAIIDEPYRQVGMETLRKQVETELKNCSIPDVVGRSEQLKAFMKFADWYKDEYKQHIPLGAIKEYVKSL